MKTYTITAITKANRTEYFHAVTVEAENVKEAKEKAYDQIAATLDRHAFRMSNATAAASVEYAQWIARRFNVTVEDVMKAAAEPAGVDAYDFRPAINHAENRAISAADKCKAAADQAETAETPEAASYAARKANHYAEHAAKDAAEAGTEAAAEAAKNARENADRAQEAAEKAAAPKAQSRAAANIIDNANATAAEINRVISGNAKIVRDACQIVKNAATEAQSTDDAARLEELKNTANAAAAAANKRMWTAYNALCTAAEYMNKAKRSAAAYKAQSTRADNRAEVAAYTFNTDSPIAKEAITSAKADAAKKHAKADAAARAAEIVQVAYEHAYIQFLTVKDEADEAKRTAELMRTPAETRKAIATEAFEEARREADAADRAEAAASAAAINYDHKAAAEHADEAEKHASAAEAAADRAAAVAAVAHDPEVSSIADSTSEEAYRARTAANSARETATLNAAEAIAKQAAQETEHTARDAAASLIDAYTAATSEDIDEDQHRAAYRVAAAELIPEGQRPKGYETAAPEDFDAVTAMVERIASQIYGIVILDADGAETEVMSYQTKAERDEAERHLNLSECEYMGAMGEYDYYREPDRAAKADAAADALTREYRAIVNDHPTTTPDPCTREAEAARRVARRDIAHELGATRKDREIVSYMVEAIAIQAAEEYAQR